jgi:hypothetical protein
MFGLVKNGKFVMESMYTLVDIGIFLPIQDGDGFRVIGHAEEVGIGFPVIGEGDKWD